MQKSTRAVKYVVAVCFVFIVLAGFVFAGCNNGDGDKTEDLSAIRIVNNNDIEIRFESVENAVSYDIYRANSRLSEYSLIDNVKTTKYVDGNPNYDKYANYYKVVPVFSDGVATDEEKERIISFEIEMFGENTRFYDAAYDDIDAIAEDVNLIGNYTFDKEFGIGRHALYFKPGTYSGFEFPDDGNPKQLTVGFYTSFAGLGLYPSDVSLECTVGTRPAIVGSNNVTTTFWRSIENLEIAAADDNTRLRWGVSQAAPLRRMNVKVPTVFDLGGNASGGFGADSVFQSTVGSNSQQQWYNRNCDYSEQFTGVNWNKVSQGCVGIPHMDNYATGGPSTWISETPVIREKPFLFFDGDLEYKVFVPALREAASGPSWSDMDAGEGEVIEFAQNFYSAKPSDSAAEINAQLSKGKHIYFTPGWYFLDEPIKVTKPDTIILGSGYATLVPSETNAEGAMLVSDVDGVSIAGILFDEHYKSKYLLRVGETGANKDHSENPTVLSDVFLRVGGFINTPTHADVTIEVNSSDVIGDHLWVWRADHGRENELYNGREGVGWDRNTAPYGVVVFGDNVTMYGLFVEHYQKYQTLWLGENGKTFFYQNESPYDPQGQSSYMSHNGTVKGYSAYKVANNVKTHYAIGLGLYGVFRRVGTNGKVFLDNAVEVPNTPGVEIWHACIIELGGTESGNNGGGTNSIVNGAGDGTSTTSRKYLVSYIDGIADCPGSKTTGIQPGDEEFILYE